MPMPIRASVALAVSVLFASGCGGGSGPEAADQAPSSEGNSGCTERDGGWFGRTAEGGMIVSQTREACEQRLGG